MNDGSLPNLFSPIRISKLEVKNRIIMPALILNYPLKDTELGDEWLTFYKQRAQGGAGLIIVGACHVAPEGRQDEHQIGVDHDGWLPTLEKVSRVIADNGAVPALQLNHAGRYSKKKISGMDPVAPSAIVSKYTRELPRALTAGEVEATIEAFAQAALRAKKAGFQAIELLGATGYLISQFLSAVTNQREDRYGGDFNGRLTFVREMIQAIKAEVGDDYPLIFRLSSKDNVAGGLDENDQLELAKKLSAWGVHLMNVTAGWHDAPVHQIGPSVPEGYFVPYATRIKNEIDIPVSCAMRITSPEYARRVIAEGELDMVTMARALIADPEWPHKAQQGNDKNIRKCICCCNCFDRAFARSQIECSINPSVGKDNLLPASQPKHILVVGGGPAGMEAARILAERDHRVTLQEKKETLGGWLPAASAPPYKGDVSQLIQFQSTELERLGVTVQTGTGFTPSEGEFDGIIVAAGSNEKRIPIPGLENIPSYTGGEILSGAVIPPEPIIIVGAGLIGGETADFLCAKGLKVSLVEIQEKLLPDMGATLRWVLIQRLKKGGVAVLTSTKILEVKEDRVVIETDGELQELPAKSLVFAVGLESSHSGSDLITEVEKTSLPYCIIGDGKAPRRIKDAVHEGYWAATDWVDGLD
jgi:2,4-dienoyl-CoA reductase (NADPH2)